MSRQPIFILGAPRSGTTFLASLLETTDYGAPFETHFITKYYKKLSQYGDLSVYENFEKLLKSILAERPVMQWELDLDTKAFYDSLGSDRSYRNIVDQLCLMASQKAGYSNWGDKTPHYLDDVDILYTLFPEAKYIYIVRDGRDVALSLVRKPWGPANIYTAAKYWKLLNRESEILTKLESSGNMMSLQYEHLLGDMISYVRRIYEFLGMPCTPEQEEKYNKTAKTSNFDKWKQEMTEKEQKVFDLVAADTLRRFGYETKYDEGTVPVSTVMYYELHEFVLRWKHLFVANVIDTIKIKFFGKQPFAD